MRLISSALISISLWLQSSSRSAALQFPAQALELRLDAPVEDFGTDLRDEAADDLRIGTRVEHDRVPGGGGEGVANASQLVVGEGTPAGHGRAHPADLFVDHFAVGAGDGRQ